MSKYASNGHENGPRSRLRGPFPLVALGRFSPNMFLTGVQDDVYEVDRRADEAAVSGSLAERSGFEEFGE